MKTRRWAAGSLTLLSWQASAAISVPANGFVYTQDFNSLAANGGSSITTAAWVNDGTLPGWSLFTSTLGPPPTYRAEIGNQDIGSFNSHGAGGSSDRALGAIGADNSDFGSPPAGSVAGDIAVAFTNNTGGTIDSFTLSFSGEQWRYSNAPAQQMVLNFGLGNSFAAVADWVAPGGSFDWSSPLTGAPGLGGIDGNGIGRVAGVGGTQVLTWAAGETLWLRWIERNDVGADHGLGIDDLSFSVTAVPEPAAWLLLVGGLAPLKLRRAGPHSKRADGGCG